MPIMEYMVVMVCTVCTRCMDQSSHPCVSHHSHISLSKSFNLYIDKYLIKNIYIYRDLYKNLILYIVKYLIIYMINERKGYRRGKCGIGVCVQVWDIRCVHCVHNILRMNFVHSIYGIHAPSGANSTNLKVGGNQMSRVIILMVVLGVGLWVVGQATIAKEAVERRNANLVAMMEIAGK